MAPGGQRKLHAPLLPSTAHKLLMKIMDDFHLELKPSHAYHKIDTFHGE